MRKKVVKKLSLNSCTNIISQNKLMKERLFTYQTVLFTCFGKGKSVNQWFGVQEEEEGKPDDGESLNQWWCINRRWCLKRWKWWNRESERASNFLSNEIKNFIFFYWRAVVLMGIKFFLRPMAGGGPALLTCLQYVAFYLRYTTRDNPLF